MSKASDFLGGGGTPKTQTFTSSGTWIHPKPGEIVHVWVSELWSGGGSGSAYATETASGGGCSGMSSLLLSVTNNLTINVGAGGVGSNGIGTDGGVTEILDSSGNLLLSAGAGGGGGDGFEDWNGKSGRGTAWEGWSRRPSAQELVLNRPSPASSPWAKSGAEPNSTVNAGSAAKGPGGDGSQFDGTGAGNGGIGAGGGASNGGVAGDGGDVYVVLNLDE